MPPPYELQHHLPLSGTAADAFLLATCPHVADLDTCPEEEEADKVAYGAMQVVSRYGPQLQHMLLKSRALPRLALHSLPPCTGLVRLELKHEEYPRGGILVGAWVEGLPRWWPGGPHWRRKKSLHVA